MPLMNWLRSLLGMSFRTRKTRKPSQRQRLSHKKPFRLQLETLEDRVVPSGVVEPNYVAMPLSQVSPDYQGSGPGGGFTPSNIQTAYGISTLLANGDNGAGQTIALIDAYDNPDFVSSSNANFSTSDLAVFDAQYGLPNPNFVKYGQVNGGSTFTTNFGTSGVPGVDPSGPGLDDWEGEEALDVEWAHALAPQANIVLVEADDFSTNIFAAADFAATPVANGGLGASVVSMSFGYDGGFAGENSFDSDFSPTLYPGVTFIASAGDSGSVNPNTYSDGNGSGATGQACYPADSPNVLAVGGTSLTVVGSGNFTYSKETVWNDGFGFGQVFNTYGATGGGVSNFESQPNFQATAAAGISTTQRVAPDVAFDADVATGVSVYDSYDDPGYPFDLAGGTSLSAPCWAALVAISDQIRAANGVAPLTGATQTLPSLYNFDKSPATYASNFHDITTGNNGTYPATTGYDAVTGLGTPIANNLVPDLADALLYTAPAGTNSIRLVQSGSNFEVFVNSVLVDKQAIAFTSSIEINGATGSNNSLTVDYSGGVFNTVPITFDGGSGSSFSQHHR